MSIAGAIDHGTGSGDVELTARGSKTRLEKTSLNLEHVRVLVADVACRPCYLRTCPIDHRCMTRIAPEQAIAAALPTLAKRAVA